MTGLGAVTMNQDFGHPMPPGEECLNHHRAAVTMDMDHIVSVSQEPVQCPDIVHYTLFPAGNNNNPSKLLKLFPDSYVNGVKCQEIYLKARPVH